MQFGERMRLVLKLAALGLVATGLMLAAAHYLRSFHIAYRVAYSTGDHGGGKLLQSVGQAAKDEKTWISFQKTPLPTLDDAAKALETGKADIALIRPDVAAPDNATLIAVLRKDAVFLIAPAKSPIESIKDLKGKAVAVLSTLPADEALLDKVLEHYSVAPASVRRVKLSIAGLGAAIKQKTVDAVFLISAPESAQSAEAFAAVARATRSAPDIIGVDDAEGIAKRLPNVGTVDIDQGVFAGASPRPEETVTTLAVSYRLVASRKLSNMAAGEIARLVLAAKARMAASRSEIDTIEAPDTDDLALNLHPGAKAFFDGEQPSFLDRFESLFWIGSALLSVIASGFAWLLSRLPWKRDGGEDSINLAKLVAFLTEIRVADAATLEQLKGKLDDFVRSIVRGRSDGVLEPEDFHSLSIAVGYARQAIADRRDQLLGKMS